MLSISVHAVDESRSIRLVGPDIMILRQHYHKHQGWLPFVQAIIVDFEHRGDRHRNPVVRKSKSQIREIVENRYYRCDESCRMLYHYEKNVPQLVLPFDGWRKLNKSQWKRIVYAKFPGWERDTNGDLLEFTFSEETSATVRNWCSENCAGRFYVGGKTAILELASDYVIAKVGFGG